MENKNNERLPSDKLNTFFTVIYGVYKATPNSKLESINKVLTLANESAKSLLLKMQNTFETGKLQYLPIESILNAVYFCLPMEGRVFLQNLVAEKMGQTVSAATKIIDGVVKGDNSKQQVEKFLEGVGVVSDELIVKFQKIVYLETGHMPFITLYPVRRDMSDPYSEVSVRVDIFSASRQPLYAPMSLPDYLLFIRERVLMYANVDVDKELFARSQQKQLG